MKCQHTNISHRFHTISQIWFRCNDCGSHVANIKGKLQAVDVIHKGGSNYDLKIKETKELVPYSNIVEEDQS